MKWFAGVATATGILLGTAYAAESANPAADFLKAADNGEIANMRALLRNDVRAENGRRLSPSEFFKKLENCYLRAVYADKNRPGMLVGTWMCSVPSDQNQSRVLIVYIANTDKGPQLFDLVEIQNKRPAPPRTGSALADRAQGNVATKEGSPEQIFVGAYPADTPWKKITDNHDDKQTFIEWIPENQNPNDVKDILTEQVFPAQKGANASSFVTDFLRRVGGACRAAKVNGPKAQTELGFSVAYAQAYCVGNSGKDVDIFIKAISGKAALYVVQREFRRPAQPNARPGLMQFKDLAAGRATLEAQGIANKFLVDRVKLCANGTADDGCANEK